MGALVKAEFRKIFSTNLWWGLLIPTVLLGFGWSWLFSKLGSTITEGIRNAPELRGIDAEMFLFSVFGFARATNLSTIFPMILGAMALASEIGQKTITTTYLTAPTRGAVLVAKTITYSLVGLGYGLVVALMASLGTMVGAGDAPLPEGGGWALLFLTAILETLLWTLFGVGVGALLGNVIGSVLLLLFYTLLVENVVVLSINPGISGFLPNGSASGMPGAVAADLFMEKLDSLVPSQYVEDVQEVVRAAAGAPGAFDWWLSTLIFLVYTVAFLALGWLASLKRDIT
ncbi:MAG TPA: ABC transporter permease subunit [Pseudonocardiaceae bacterium]